jgi:hypothetical protein
MSRIMQEVRIQTQAPPPAARGVDPAEINRRVEDAVNQAISQIGDNQQDNARESIREAIQDIQQEIQEARAEGRSITIQPQFGDNVIPRQAVDISIAFFVSMAFIIVGLPIARAWARRMDRRGETASASQIAPRLDRIEQAVEAIAIEVERVSEGQRYTTKAIAELRGLPVPNAGGWSAREAERVPAGERRP